MRMRIAPLADGTTEVDIKLLPDGRTLVHWLRECETGLVTLVGHPKLREVMGRQPTGHYSVACRPKQNTVSSQKRGSTRFMCMISGDLAAVTCPECLATKEAVAALSAPPPDDAKAAQMAMESVKSVNSALGV